MVNFQNSEFENDSVKIQIILNFANNLLSNSIDLKKDVSKMVDEDF